MPIVRLRSASLHNDDATIVSIASRSAYSVLGAIKQSARKFHRSDPRKGTSNTNEVTNAESPAQTFSTVAESISESSSDDAMDKLGNSFSLFKTSSSHDHNVKTNSFDHDYNDNVARERTDSTMGGFDGAQEWDSGLLTGEYLDGRADNILQQLEISESESRLFESSFADMKPLTSLGDDSSPASESSLSMWQNDQTNHFSLLEDTRAHHDNDEEDEGSHTEASAYTSYSEDDYGSVSTHDSKENWTEGMVFVGQAVYAVGTGNCTFNDLLIDYEDEITLDDDESVRDDVSYLGYSEEREIRRMNARSNAPITSSATTAKQHILSMFSCTG